MACVLRAAASRRHRHRTTARDSHLQRVSGAMTTRWDSCSAPSVTGENKALASSLTAYLVAAGAAAAEALVTGGLRQQRRRHVERGGTACWLCSNCTNTHLMTVMRLPAAAVAAEAWRVWASAAGLIGRALCLLLKDVCD